MTEGHYFTFGIAEYFINNAHVFQTANLTVSSLFLSFFPYKSRQIQTKVFGSIRVHWDTECVGISLMTNVVFCAILGV